MMLLHVSSSRQIRRAGALAIALLLLASTALAAPPPGRGGPPEDAGPPEGQGPDRDSPINPVGVAVADANATEGSPVDFLVTLDTAATVEVTVTYGTNDATALAGTHYTSTSGDLVIPAGETAATISVPTDDDETQNEDRTFTLDLTAVSSNGTITDGSGTGTIQDDDEATATPSLSVGDVTVVEGEQANFLVTLSGVASQDVTFDYATADGSAVATVDNAAREAPDYEEANGSGTIAQGETSTIVTVQTLDDTSLDADGVDEPDETFTLSVSNVAGADVADATGTGTIQDNDAAPVLRLFDRSVDEFAGHVSATIDLVGRSSEEITLDFDSFTDTGDTASEDVDYTPASAQITIPAGSTTGTAGPTQLTDDDEMWEGDETFTVVISNVSDNASIETDGDTATITIEDDDGVTGCSDIIDGHEDGNDSIDDFPGPIDERQELFPGEYTLGATSHACQGDHDWWRLDLPEPNAGDEFLITILGENLDGVQITAEFHPFVGDPETLTVQQEESDPLSLDPNSGDPGGWSVPFTSDGTPGNIFVDVFLPGSDPDLGVQYAIGYVPFIEPPEDFDEE